MSVPDPAPQAAAPVADEIYERLRAEAEAQLARSRLLLDQMQRLIDIAETLLDARQKDRRPL